MTKFFDPNIVRKSNISNKNLKFISGTDIALPSVVEISESGTCNRVCSFCPRSDPNYPDINEFISEKLHTKLFKELSDYNYSGSVIYSGFVEPLLDKNIYELIGTARKYLPLSNIEIITNGDVLNKDRLKKLFDKGLTTILISVYDSKEDAELFEELCVGSGLKKEQYVIRHRYLPPEQDYGITMSNRGGLLKDAVHSIQPLAKSLKAPCYYPSYTFFVDYNGDVLMCSHDWGKKNILGNLNKQTFFEIWTGHLSSLARKKLNKGDRNFSPCDVCDVQGTLIGKSHSDAWMKKIEK